jgi:ATP-binding cassette, subfamily B, bacterial
MTEETIEKFSPTEFTNSLKFKTNTSTPTKWLISHFLPYWPIGVILFTGAFSNAALAAVVPNYIGKAFDTILQSSDNLSTLVPMVWIIIISQVIRGALQFGRNFGAEWLGQLFERNIREELYSSLLGKSMTFHNLQPVGDTMARAINDVREINLMFNPGINLVIGSANFLLIPLIASPRIHPELLLAPVLFTLSYTISIKQYLATLQPITTAVRDAFGKLNTRLAEAIDGVETVKGMAQEENEVLRFKLNAQEFRDATVVQGDVEAKYIPLLLLGISQAFGLIHSLILFTRGELTAGDVVNYFGLLQLFGFPTFVSFFAYSQVSLGIAGSRRILELINRETDLDQNLAGFKKQSTGTIEFKNVNFGYDKNPILKNISFKVEPGQTVAIVGQTGAGKTTLAKLVNRTYDVTSGEVLIDGINVKDWQLESLRKQISIIEQDIFLFSRTVSENIAFGNPEATQEEIETVAKEAQAHEFILSFEDGYQTVIGERGATLSGGQKQRIALARAFLSNPQILVLDDSTSAIDSATEDKIQRAIFAAAKGRTTLIITHRLSQIRWADLIVVVKHGEIIAVGKHEELLINSEAYQKIFSE